MAKKASTKKIAAKATTKKAAAQERVSRVEVKPKVVRSIVRVADNVNPANPMTIDVVNGRESVKLFDDLKLDDDRRGRLKASYNRIIDSYQGVRIGIQEARNLKTVGEAIALVHKKSNA
ncbi:hypothetical protein GCM10023213_07220 [Prosthecobacter algae]|uniref:Uncharacterized protein n=1 Tax=Prosthecobacter algae TaxID=1144682 RepID=A0ABP9NYP9_9BACT